MRTQEPAFPTFVKRRYENGLLRGTHRSVWLVKEIPMETIVGAPTVRNVIDASIPLMGAFDELAKLSGTGLGERRAVSKSKYREVQLLLVNVPSRFKIPHEHPNKAYLTRNYSGSPVDDRVLLLAVRLIPELGGNKKSFRSMVNSMVDSIAEAEAPLEDFEPDRIRVDRALSRVGLATPTSHAVSLANSWWNYGRFADTPVLPHGDHMHFFSTSEAMRQASSIGKSECEKWETFPNTMTTTFTSVEDLDFGHIKATSPIAQWVADLIDYGARAVSIRGLVEPTKSTRKEIRAQLKRVRDDIREREEAQKMSLADQGEEEALLDQVLSHYETGSGTPTLVETSVLVAFDGKIDDVEAVAPDSPVSLAMMIDRQDAAWEEMKLCSPVRANPNFHDLPSQAIAFSAVQSLSRVGDKSGALLGFTERDRQAAWLSPDAASRKDSAPIAIIGGSTGSGKTMLLLNLAVQMCAEKPNVIVDLKMGSDHSEVLEAMVGDALKVISLSDLEDQGGILDPLRFSANPQDGIDLALTLLSGFNPWGDMNEKLEVDLLSVLKFGVTHGADCIGMALKIAKEKGNPYATDELLDPVFKLAESHGFAHIMIGMENGGPKLGTSSKLTYIHLGNKHLDLPPEGATLKDKLGINQRATIMLTQMLVYGVGSALAQHGGGVIHLDEGWIFMKSGPQAMEMTGRLARSWDLLIMIYTQKMRDAVKADLKAYLSRGIILPLDEDEAYLACELFKLEPTPHRISRITGKAELSEYSDQPNWNSMRALRDPGTGEVIRGTIMTYIDLKENAVNVEHRLSEEFLRLASTTPEEVRRRKAEKLKREAEQADQVIEFPGDERAAG